MDEFLSDDEQAERTKKWLREFGPFIVAGVVIGLGGLFGYQSWEKARDAERVAASSVFDQLQSAVEGERFNEVDETLALLASDYDWTPYLDQARLAVATMHMGQNEPADALEQLNLLIKNPHDKQLARIAELRAAQIHIYLEDYDAALAALGTQDESAYAAQFHDLRGDALYARGDLDAAREEYEAALDVERFGTIDRVYVQMKLDDVIGSLAATTAAAEPSAEPATEPAAEAADNAE